MKLTINRITFGIIILILNSVIFSCNNTYKQTICDGNGFEVFGEFKKTEIIKNGTYFIFNNASGKNKNGFFYYANKKIGTIRFDSKGRITDEIYKTTLDSMKVEMKFLLNYDNEYFKKFVLYINDIKASEIDLEYTLGSLTKANVDGINILLGKNLIGSGNNRVKISILFEYSPYEVTKKYIDLNQKIVLTEVVKFTDEDKIPLFIDPVTCFDVQRYLEKGMKVKTRKYFENGIEITNVTAMEKLGLTTAATL